jgi:NRPS condensation-like uncharacterized protein
LFEEEIIRSPFSLRIKKKELMKMKKEIRQSVACHRLSTNLG